MEGPIINGQLDDIVWQVLEVCHVLSGAYSWDKRMVREKRTTLDPLDLYLYSAETTAKGHRLRNFVRVKFLFTCSRE